MNSFIINPIIFFKNHTFKLLVISIVPILIILFGFYLKNSQPSNYLYCVDPEYCYLFNALNFAHLQHPFHIDHPGTPLQMLSSIIIRIVHIFHNSNITLDEDVFSNPDLFIYSINICTIILSSVMLFLLGLFTLKWTHDLTSAFFLQLTPFSSYIIISLFDRLIPENLLIPVTLLLILLIISNLNSSNTKNNILKFIILFSALIGFGTAVKITFVPFFIIPLFLIPGVINKLKYSILSIVFFSLFAYPIFFRWVDFRNWVESLFIHSGQYGAGPSNLIDKHIFITNIKTIIFQEQIFTFSLLIFIITSSIYFITYFKFKLKEDKYFNALLGITVTMILILIMVAKQYKNYYITPGLLLVVPGIYLTIYIYNRRLGFKSNWIIIPGLLIFILCLYHFQIKNVFKFSATRHENKEHYMESYGIDKKYTGKPILMICNYTGSAFKQYALLFGIVWTGGSDTKMHKWYAATLSKMYPDAYIYKSYDNLFSDWSNSFSFITLLKKYKQVYLDTRDQEVKESLTTKFNGLNRQTDTKDTLVYKNNYSLETIYKFTFDSSENSRHLRYECDAENTDSTKFNFITDGLIFKNGNTQSDEQAYKGKFSAKLTKDKPYGMTCSLSEVQTGEKYSISIWRYKNGNLNSGLVISTNNSSLFYNCVSITSETSAKWEKLEYILSVNEQINNCDINIYCWNYDQSLPAYFDNLVIERIH